MIRTASLIKLSSKGVASCPRSVRFVALAAKIGPCHRFSQLARENTGSAASILATCGARKLSLTKRGANLLTKLPRELLWAIIVSLIIAVFALWPTTYPYSRSSHAPANHTEAHELTQATNHEQELTILGIKPGEWLLSIATLMLWAATVKLVRGADKTAEKQLRAYVSVESGGYLRQRAGLRFEFRPNIINNGSTPAKDVRITSQIGIIPPTIAPNFNYLIQDWEGGSVSTIAPHQGRRHSVVVAKRLSKQELREVVRGRLVFHVYGTVRYLDIFDQERRTNFNYVIFLGRKRDDPIWHYHEQNNDAT
jgi:hypothetical protein